MTARSGFLALGIVGVLLLLPSLRAARADVAADLAAARQLQAQERWAASESLATAVLARLEAEASPDSLAMAEALHHIGTARWRLVGYADGSGLRAASRALGIRTRRLPADHLDLAEAHGLVARFLPELGRPDSAKAHVRRALAIRAGRLAPNDTLIAKTWDQLALIQRGSGDFEGALESWTRAIAIREAAHGPEHPEVARLIAQTGVPWMELGELDKAREVLERSLRLFARAGGDDLPGRWIPLNILADVEKRTGNRARNVDLLQEALRVVRLNYGDDSREALTLRSNLAIALYELSDNVAAVAVWKEILPRVEAQYGPSHVRTLTLRHGMAMSSRAAGDHATTIRLLRGIDSVLASRDGPPPRLLPIVQGQLADALFWDGQDQESRAMGERALRSAYALRRPEEIVSIYALLIPTLAAIGDTVALDSVRRAMLESERQLASGTIAAAQLAQFNAAWASRHLGRTAEAWGHALEAEQRSREQLRFNLQALPDRRALLLAKTEGRYLDLILDLDRGADVTRHQTAWDRLVRARGQVRSEVARRRQPHGLESDTAIARLHEDWLAAQRRWARRLVNSGGARGDSTGRAALERLRAAAEESEGAYARALERHGSRVPVMEVGLEDVRGRLRPGQALVGCVEIGRILDRRARERVVAFVARGGSAAIERVELGLSSDLRGVLDPWRARLAVSPGRDRRRGDRAERECRALGVAARAATWDPIATHLAGIQDVFIVADGPLVDLPWHALPDGSRGYLVESGARIHLLHAERDLAGAMPTPATASLLAVGAPDYARDREPSVSTAVAALVRSAPDPCMDGTLPEFASLPGSGAEAEAVARAWRSVPRHDATVLTGARATEQAFKREARGKAVVHLATHGVVAGDRCAPGGSTTRGVGGLDPLIVPASARPASKPGASAAPAPAETPRAISPWMPRRVWLALAGANQARDHALDENEGFLTAEEVLTLNLQETEWVVLSACHSGLADVWSREGALGMRRAFDLAGARTVFASQWAVEDAATLEWMQALYAARAGGVTSGGAALASASRGVLAARRRDGRSTHPFYWAAFSATGE